MEWAPLRRPEMIKCRLCGHSREAYTSEKCPECGSSISGVMKKFASRLAFIVGMVLVIAFVSVVVGRLFD